MKVGGAVVPARWSLGEAAAAVVGGDRFRLWTGRSGRRHVFTRVEADDASADLDGAVVLIESRDRTGAPVVRIEAGGAAGRRARSCGTVWAHFLADTEEARRAVAADLTPFSGRA